jgi:hypothetical protein
MLLTSFLASLGLRFDRRDVRQRGNLSARRVTVSESLETRALLVVSIAATNVDSLLTDVDSDGLADAGDTLFNIVPTALTTTPQLLSWLDLSAVTAAT